MVQYIIYLSHLPTPYSDQKLLYCCDTDRLGLTKPTAQCVREYNQWADDLTHMDFKDFDMSKCLSILDTTPWQTLEHLVASFDHAPDAFGSDQQGTSPWSMHRGEPCNAQDVRGKSSPFSHM